MVKTNLFQNIYCFALLGLVSYSCRVSLPAERSAKSLSEPVYVENIADSYLLHLDRPASDFRINLEVSPEAVNLNTKDNAPDSVMVFKNPKKSRPYFDLVSGDDTIFVANRHIDFDKIVNFRDLGGLKTKDGKMVKWGKIFRSDNLSELKSSEFSRFNQLAIATVFDLRTDHEIEGKEDHLPANVKYLHTPTVADNEGEIAKLRKKVISGLISESEAARQTTQFYQDAVTVNVGALKEIIQQITGSEEPVLYHCSAGKDRTGIISALLLSILNVDRETIVDEYMMSNYYRRAKTEKMLGKAKLAKIIKPKMDLKAIEVFMTVDKNFINATFDSIDKTYGGIEPFIKNQLGIDTEMRKRIIANLTN